MRRGTPASTERDVDGGDAACGGCAACVCAPLRALTERTLRDDDSDEERVRKTATVPVVWIGSGYGFCATTLGAAIGGSASLVLLVYALLLRRLPLVLVEACLSLAAVAAMLMDWSVQT
eukprot:gene33514-372_t